MILAETNQSVLAWLINQAMTEQLVDHHSLDAYPHQSISVSSLSTPHFSPPSILTLLTSTSHPSACDVALQDMLRGDFSDSPSLVPYGAKHLFDTGFTSCCV